jgi:hypothetical protein
VIHAVAVQVGLCSSVLVLLTMKEGSADFQIDFFKCKILYYKVSFTSNLFTILKSEHPTSAKRQYKVVPGAFVPSSKHIF